MPPTSALSLFLLTAFTAGQLSAQSTDTAGTHRDRMVPGGGALPSGWSARPDEDGDIKDVKFVVMEPGYHLTLGPATILYRTQDNASGPFHTLAKFHQMKRWEHPEGYGLFMGGQNLTTKNQTYTYFLVRDDGTYLIKRRVGSKTSEITRGWTAHSAIKKASAEGKATNLLEIDAKLDARTVAFKVNGQTVHTADPKNMDLKGVVGLRVNHNLDLHVEDFALHQ